MTITLDIRSSATGGHSRPNTRLGHRTSGFCYRLLYSTIAMTICWSTKHGKVANKRAGHVGRKRVLNLVWFWWNSECELLYTVVIRDDNWVKIAHIVAELQTCKFKTRGCVYLNRHVYSALYSTIKCFSIGASKFSGIFQILNVFVGDVQLYFGIISICPVYTLWHRCM